ncbi:MAG TPA: NYN domain-containing protein [Chryseosolibacter sp.]|nr:NYN domain-containing protein [Chryseosolibacter sp.]
MPIERSKELRLAVIIDADNVPYGNVKAMMEEIAKYGTPTFKRIYGDWTKPNTSGWKSVLLENAITPIQQYGYTVGKNATDSAMIIDAMDILYSGRVEGFCIVSSDSDFTRLAIRLREAGMVVIGIGERKTPEPFITACDKFIYIEILNYDEPHTDGAAKKRGRGKKTETPQFDKRTLNVIKSSINDLADESGWAFLGEVGTLILKKQPNFDSRNYGFKKLLHLMKSFDSIEVDERQSETGTSRHVYVRVRQ